MSKMKLLSSFQLATQILTFQPINANFIIRSFTKLSEDKRILFLEPAIKAKLLTFVLPTEKRLVSFLDFFQISR